MRGSMQIEGDAREDSREERTLGDTRAGAVGGRSGVTTGVADLVGSQILSLLTMGMYWDPRALYREYLQNAADAADEGMDEAQVEVEIAIDVAARSVRIRDNGPGLGPELARRQLVPVGRSSKVGKDQRGFRGIGRLAGLAFAETVRFRTRNRKDAPVVEIVWDGEKLRSLGETGVSAREVIENSVDVRRVSGNAYPEHFFEVQLECVRRAVANTVLNADAVREYIGVVCPVPFREELMGNPCIREVAGVGRGGSALEVRVNGQGCPIYRLLQEEIPARGGAWDRLHDFERVAIPAMDDGGEGRFAAVGWIAHSSYLGALPQAVALRGVRARVGNIQVGSENVFEHLFSERRFNQWCIAEIHVLDRRIRPNGRRDYFEGNAYLRHFENHLRVICRRLEKRCRKESRTRNSQRRRRQVVEEARAVLWLVQVGALDLESSRAAIERRLSELGKVEGAELVAERASMSGEGVSEVGALKDHLMSCLETPSVKALDGIPEVEANTYREIFGALVTTMSSPCDAQRTIEAILTAKREEQVAVQPPPA